MVGAVESRSNIKFLYSYGGKIIPRSIDGKLRYVGGHTRVLSVRRDISFAELLVRFGESCGSSVTLRCQLPTEDLDMLISVTSDDDLANLIEEYDRAAADSTKIRAILSPPKSLKVVSPPPCSATGVDRRKLDAALKPPLSLSGSVRSSSSPAVGFPVAGQRDAAKVPYHPCRVQGNPNPLHLVPYWNRRRQ